MGYQTTRSTNLGKKSNYNVKLESDLSWWWDSNAKFYTLVVLATLKDLKVALGGYLRGPPSLGRYSQSILSYLKAIFLLGKKRL